MAAVILRRLGQAGITLLGGAVITFLMLAATPGDPAARVLMARGQESITGAQILAERHALGLDRPLLVRMWDHLTGLLRGDLGTSWSTGHPVTEELAARLGPTARLTVVALVMAIAFSLLLGLLAAWGDGRLPDHVSRAVSLVFLVVPSFVVGIVALDVLVVRFGQGTVIADGGWRTVWLPALTLALASAASWSRVLRASVLDARGAPFLLVSHARGASRVRRLLSHELPNALSPYVTIVGIEVAVLLGGAPIVESIYSWPGVGRFTVQAVEGRDMPVVVGFAMLAIGLFVVASLLVDVVNALIDARQREAR
jgi:ABC-type dipeptide/oligopeptide/nickel transport system permease component